MSASCGVCVCIIPLAVARSTDYNIHETEWSTEKPELGLTFSEDGEGIGSAAAVGVGVGVGVVAAVGEAE